MYVILYVHIHIYVWINRLSYFVYVVFLLRSSEIAHYCTYISVDSTERMGEGAMRKKHEHIHTAREEWSNEVALIQALRR